MKAADVLRRYANGERDFHRANLRGANFRGKDLSGADFTEAEIHGANFVNANLKGTIFTAARAGVQRRWFAAQWLIALTLSILLNFISTVLNAALLSALLSSRNIEDYTIFPGIFMVVAIAIIFLSVAHQGFTSKAAETITFAVAFAVTVAFAVAFAFAFAFAVTVAFAVASAGAGAVAFAFAFAVAFTFAVTFAVAGAVAVAGASAVAFVVAVAFTFAFAGAFAGAGAVALLSGYVAWRTVKGDEKFALVRSMGVVLGALGGTQFCGANLQEATFARAMLKSTNFNASRQQDTQLTDVDWSGAAKLDFAQLGSSVLANPAMRQLLTTRNGYKKSYINANLRGANLRGINLQGADLQRADLSAARLQKADLRGANLREVLAGGANFAGASLTGACLEAWNIDHTTNLENVDCQYVFLLQHPNALGSRERRPHDPNAVFAPGDFEKLYRQIIDTVQILLRNGVNPESFREAFQQLMTEHPEMSLDSIVGFEKKGQDVLLTLAVDDTVDKAQIAQAFLNPYQERVLQLEAEVRLHQLRAADMKEIVLSLASQPNITTNQLIGTGTAMTDHTNNSQNISIGGNFTVTNSVVTLGDLNGSVTNTISQIPSSPDGDRLKQLLVQLQAVLVEADPAALSPDDKADALLEVKQLAEAAQKPEAEQKNLGAQAMRSLRRIVAAIPVAVPTTTALLKAFNELLPAIAHLMGL